MALIILGVLVFLLVVAAELGQDGGDDPTDLNP